MANHYKEGTWFLNGKKVPEESIKSFNKTGEQYELNIEYFSGLRELVKINSVQHEVEGSNGLNVEEFKVVDERRVMADEGDSGIEPGTTLVLEKKHP